MSIVKKMIAIFVMSFSCSSFAWFGDLYEQIKPGYTEYKRTSMLESVCEGFERDFDYLTSSPKPWLYGAAFFAFLYGVVKFLDYKNVRLHHVSHEEERQYFKEKYGWDWATYELAQAMFREVHYEICCDKRVDEIYSQQRAEGQIPYALNRKNVEIYAEYVKIMYPNEYAHKSKKRK